MLNLNKKKNVIKYFRLLFCLQSKTTLLQPTRYISSVKFPLAIPISYKTPNLKKKSSNNPQLHDSPRSKTSHFLNYNSTNSHKENSLIRHDINSSSNSWKTDHRTPIKTAFRPFGFSFQAEAFSSTEFQSSKNTPNQTHNWAYRGSEPLSLSVFENVISI